MTAIETRERHTELRNEKRRAMNKITSDLGFKTKKQFLKWLKKKKYVKSNNSK